MNKKTITTLAFTAASMAFGLTPPPKVTKTVCLAVHEDAEGALRAGSCDESRNNGLKHLVILKNGCAENQVSVISLKHTETSPFTVTVPLCWAPGVVQL